MRKPRSPDQEATILEELVRTGKVNEDCSDGEHCAVKYAQISEAQLLEHLQSG
jgi:hypothetical protein